MKVLILLSLILFSSVYTKKVNPFSRESAFNYTEVVERIYNAHYGVNSSQLKYAAYNRTMYLVETFGPRLWGSLNLEKAIDFMVDEMKANKFDNPRKELVPNITNWSRGEERLLLLFPHPTPTKIPMIGLGGSVGGNVTAEIIVVHSFDELDRKKAEVSGKIVVFNEEWKGYGTTVIYRAKCAIASSQYGALATLIRSIAPETYETPHTGALWYDSNVKRIPAAAISIQSANLLDHLYRRGQKVVLNLYMEATYHPEAKNSHNVVGELRGSTFPNEIITLGGHIDSWDVGPQTGANDDGAGFMVCFEAVRLLIKLGLRPKRTLRFIAYSGEEWGSPNSGAPAYVKTHLNEMDDHVLGFESDFGTTSLLGFGFTGSEKAKLIVNDIATKYLQKLNSTQITDDGESQDVEPLHSQFNIPIMNNFIKHEDKGADYFRRHHSSIDNMDALNPDTMDENVRGIAAMLFIIADLPEKLPRD